ncbi:NAD-dependent epimerase/dehydratase family protein [Streptomyces sp. NPDC058000]|uniref:NAD-dependent epimerase/dehydratase family protein n=1 Tax=Streptomyces sp. NPDC058000 TaxID=3346299 RepID=UPI0036EDE372
MRVTLLGATGFVGSAVLRELAGTGVRVRAVARRTPPRAGAGSGDVEWVRADLADPASLHGLCDDSGVLLHFASHVGPDEEQCRAVNVHGTRAAVAEARRAGTRRIVLLSTAAVYGAGPHRGIRTGEVTPEPVSAVSRSRLAAEEPVLAAGGVVLRPGLILGAGDRWVVPALQDALLRVPARWDAGRALLSLVHVADLARLTAGLATAPGAGVGPGGYHASHPDPVRLDDLIAALARCGAVERPEPAWSLARCLDALRDTPGWVSERQFRLFAEDHWYRSDTVWSAAGVDPGPGPLARLLRDDRPVGD